MPALVNAPYLLTADIGGTNSRLGFFAHGKLLSSVWLPTKPDTSGALSSLFAAVCALSSSALPFSPEKAAAFAIALAGPVSAPVFHGTCRMQLAKLSNADVCFDSVKIAQTWGIPHVQLFNDFTAQAYGLLSPAIVNAVPLFNAPPFPASLPSSGSFALLGAGTGLGMAAVHIVHGIARVLPSEGGHSAMSFMGESEHALEDWLIKRLGNAPISCENILCGHGLTLLHEYLAQTPLSAKEITAKSHFSTSPTCQYFARFYGRICRDLALTLLPFSGLVITGGLAAKNPSLLNHPEFRRAFLESPKHCKLLQTIPLYLNTNEELALWGCVEALGEGN